MAQQTGEGSVLSKIKILHVVGKMDPGGIETLLMNVYRAIDRDRYEFHFAVQHAGKGFYDDEIVALGGTIFLQPHPKKGLRAFRKQFRSNVMRHGPYDAVHSHIFQFSGYILKLAKELRVPVRVCHSHTSQDKAEQTWIRAMYRRYMRRLIDRSATHLLGCSKLACETLYGAACWQDSRVAVLPNSIDPQPYERLTGDRSALREDIGITDPEVPVIGHIGRFTEAKNHPFLLETFARFLQRKPNAQLMLVGDGSLREQTERIVREKGLEAHVTFLGVRKDIPNVIGAFDLFLLPSLFEGLGNVLIEAQAGGVPCLVSEQIPAEANLQIELVQRLSLRMEPDIWADRMEWMLHTPRPAWDVRYKSLAQRGYDIASSVRRLETIYRAGGA